MVLLVGRGGIHVLELVSHTTKQFWGRITPFLYEWQVVGPFLFIWSSCVSAAQNMCVLSGNPDPPMWGKFSESWRWGANSTSLGWDWEHHLRLCGWAGSCKLWQICLVPDFRSFVPKVKVVRGPEVCVQRTCSTPVLLELYYSLLPENQANFCSRHFRYDHTDRFRGRRE